MFEQQLINGIAQGAAYALVAIGFVLIFGVLGLIQFAHGEVYMVGAYVGHILVGIALTRSMGIGVSAGLLGAMAGAGVLGILIERVGFRPLRLAAPVASCLATIAISIVLKDLARLVFGAQTKRFVVTSFGSASFRFGDLQVSEIQLLMILVSVSLIVALQVVLYRTQTGRAIRALGQDRTAAQLMGVNIDQAIARTFAIGSALGGAAGVLVGLYYNAVYPVMGFSAGIKAFAATVLGGLTSIPGAAVGGLVLGIAENLGSAYVGEGWRDGIAFLILFGVLVFKPSGIFGTHWGNKA